MQNKSKIFTRRNLLSVFSLIAALALALTVIAQKQGGKAPAQEPKGKASQSPSQKKDGGPSQDPCPTEEGEEEPRIAANTGSGKQGWPWHPTTAAFAYNAPTCTGEFKVELNIAAKGKGTRYYQVVVPANSGLTLVSEATLNQIHSIDFPGDCDQKTLTLTFRLNKHGLSRPSRSFLIQWMKPVGNTTNASLKVGSGVPAKGYQNGKAHQVKIMCP